MKNAFRKNVQYKLGVALSVGLLSSMAFAGGGGAHGGGAGGAIVDGLGGNLGNLGNAGSSVMNYPVTTAAAISAASGAGYRLPAPRASVSATFSQYCTGSQAGGATSPLYSNAEVSEAGQILSKLSKINPRGIIQYGPIGKVYNSPEPEGVTEDAHNFLTQLCGEFRDRPSMIAEKLKWVKNIIMLNSSAPAFNMNDENPFRYLTSEKYAAFLHLSDRVWNEKNKGQTFTLPNVPQAIERRVDGNTICETKFMIRDYVLQNKSYDSRYFTSYNSFKSNCSSSDLDHYFDFRGDSNFKAQSPESNAMIWHSVSVATACKGMTGNVNGVNCADYYSKPFENRFKAARAALASWLMRAGNDNGSVVDNYSSTDIRGIMYPVFDLARLSSAPFIYSQPGTPKRDKFFPTQMNTSDFGFNSLFGNNISAKYLRIRDAVDRHTNWYQSQYNDEMGIVKSQAYSPFVASSYEMSKSDEFLACGNTVPCQEGQVREEQQKQWMFVFKVHKNNWFAAEDLLAGKQPNFDTMWFDETSFGIERLANAERAWDRLGTAMEGEFQTIIYLDNINHLSGTVTKDNSL